MSLIVGIDIGTVGATVSTIKKGALDVILNEASKRKSPALVSFHNGQRYLGEPAAGIEASNAKNTVRDMKRFVGAQWSDPEVQRDIARLANRERFRELPGDLVGVEVNHDGQTMVLDMRAVLAMQLGGLKRTSERSLKELQGTASVVRDVVLSVPPYYTDQQRRATLDSARIAGLNVLRLMNENAAVALDYGMWKNARNVFDEKTSHVLVVDIGYAATWASVIAFTKGKSTVLSCAWDRELGGRDVDVALVEQFATEFQSKTKLDPRKDVKAMLKLRNAAEKAKQTLTPEGMNKAEVYVEYLMNEIDFKTIYALEQLDVGVKPLADRVEALVKRAIADAQVQASEISAVEVVGGSSRMRQFKKAVATAAGLDASKAPNYGVLTTLNADESVSRGCALMCAILSPQFRIAATLDLKEFVPLPIKVQWEQPAVNAPASATEKEEGDESAASGTSLGLLKRTDETPKLRRVTFRRSEPFEVIASYDEPIEEWQLSAKASRIIGKYKVSGMPSGAAAKSNKIAVTFEHDKNGIFGLRSAELQVEETVTVSGDGEKKEGEADKVKKKIVKSELHVQANNGSLPEDEVEKLTRIESELTAKDKALKDRADKRNELEEFIYAARGHLDDKLKEYATQDEASRLKAKLEEDENWLYTEEGENATYQQLSSRLAALHTPYDAIQNRLMEIEARQQSAERMSQLIQQYTTVANSVEEIYAHITEDERKKVRAACTEALFWLTGQQEKQNKLPLNKDPVLTASAIDERSSKLRLECRPIVEKPKPKPASTEKPAENKPTENDKAAGEKGDKMDVEGEGDDGEAKAKKEGSKDDSKMDVEEL